MTVSADNLVRAQVDQTSVGFVDIALIDVIATIDAITRGSIAAQRAVSRGLDISVTAINVASSAAKLTSVSVGGGTGLASRATLTGTADTIAELLLGVGGLVASGAVAVAADSTNTVTATIDLTSGSLIGGQATESLATTRSLTSARVDGPILGSTGVAVTAVSRTSAIGKLATRGGSLASVNNVDAGARIFEEAATIARYGNNALVTSGAVTVSAESVQATNVETDSLSIGVAGVGTGQPTSRIDAPTTAEFGGRMTGGTSLSVIAEGKNTAKVVAGSLSAGLVGVNTTAPLALISTTADISALVTSAATVNAPNADIAVRAIGTNSATSGGGSISGGVVSITNARPKARVENTTSASLLGSIHGATATAPGARTVAMYAHADDIANATLASDGGGMVQVDTGEARAEIASGVELVLGRSGGAIVTTGAITLTAQQSPGATSAMRTAGGGVVRVGSNKASVDVRPVLTLTIAAGSTVTAGGAVTITASFNATAPSDPVIDHVFQTIDTGQDTVSFTAAHGLTTGMTLIYSGGTSGGLTDGQSYNVIVVDDDTLLLGSEFEGARVDPVANTITFGRTIAGNFVPLYHNLLDGQIVVFYANGATVPGLVNGRQYRVSVVDDSTIRLYDLTASTTPLVITVGNVDDVDDPAVTGDEAVDTINAGNGYTNGQIVIYTGPGAAGEFSSALVDIRAAADGLPYRVADMTGFTFENNDVIIIPGHSFVTGQQVYYSAGLKAALGGLVNGQTYWIIRLDGNRIRLADSYCHAVGFAGDATCFNTVLDHYDEVDDGEGNVTLVPVYVDVPILVQWLALTPDHSQEGAEVTHRLYAMNARPIDGLVDGGQYHVINRTATSFQLSHAIGGPAINLGIAGRAAGDAAGSFVAGPVDLGTGSGTGRIVIDLSAAASGTQLLKPISQFGTVPAGSRISSTTVRSSGGGFVNVQKAETTTNVNATVTVTVGSGAKVTSGDDFRLTTDALGFGTADSTNGGGGLVAVGASQSNATVIINTLVQVGAGAVIESKWNLYIQSTTRGIVRAYSNARAGGLGAGVDARSKANLTANTTIDIDGSLIAEHLLGIHGYAQPNGDVSAEANASGLGADSAGNDCGDCGLYVTSNVDIDIAGSGTVIRGDEIEIVAQMGTDAAGNGGSLRAWGYSRAKALGADSDARSRVQVRGGSTVTVHTGVVMTAWERMRLATIGTGLSIWSASKASCGCLGGDTDSAASIDYQTTSRVLTEPGVLVETAHLYVDTIQSNPGWYRDTDRSGGAFDGGSQSGGTTNTGNRPIVWEADVVLHDDNPQLYIAEDGTILKKYGVKVSNGAGTYYNVGDIVPVGTVIHVHQITNDGGATADFTTNLNGAGGDRTISGTRGSFRLQNTFDFVRLYNWSNRSMVLNGIDVVNLDDLAATVSVRASNEAQVFRFTIREPVFTETRVEAIHYWMPGNGTNNLTMAGTIYNPIGTTVVDNQHGNVLSLPGVLAIIANKVELTAMAGSIGQLGGTRAPVQVRLVESVYGKTGALTTRQVSLLVDALNDAVLDLTINRRSIATGPLNWQIDGLHAGGTIDLVLGDTLIGTDRAPLGSYEIQADVFWAGNYGSLVPPTGRYSVYFHPNSALPAFSYTDEVLVAFGTSNATAGSRFTFTDIAADVISIRHLSVASVIDLVVHSDVDANLASRQDPNVVFNTSDGVGHIDLHTNGYIIGSETVGDYLVGTITSTLANVTLTAGDAGASILDGSGITDGSARVTGNVLTLTANGTIGTLQPIRTPLTIRSSFSGAGKLVASAPDGVFITQTSGDLILTSGFASAGDVVLTVLNGSLLNEVNNGSIRVVGTNIDLIVTGGSIGSLTTGDILVDTAVDGRLFATSAGTTTANGVFITEAEGPLTVLLISSTDGQVRVTVPFVAGRDDADITLLPTGTSLDGLVTVTQGGVVALGEVELRMGNDLLAPLGTLISGADVIIRTAYGQNLAAPVGTSAYFGGTLVGATVRVFGGNGADLVQFFETVIDGNTAVFGGPTATAVGADGDDRVEITRITILPGTHLGAAGDVFDGLPVRNALSVDGQNGNNHTEVTVWGAEDTQAHDTLIEVLGTGTDPFAINTLTINASAGDDLVLLRAVNFVPNRPDARQPSMVAVASGVTTVERISYDRSVNGKLTVNGLDGNDTFALDDTSSPLTINGGGGDDAFLVGQFFSSIRTAPFVAEQDAFFTRTTDRGELSNGISRPAVLYGDDGDDQFIVSSNRSELRLEGGAGRGSFLFITSNDVPVTGASTPIENGFVSIDAGEQAVLTIVADGAAITFDDLWWTVIGAGLNLDLYGFVDEPQYVNSVTLRTPVGLDGEDGAALMRMVLPPYPFVDRGAGSSVVITETGGRTIVHPDGPLTDSYTIRLATAATHTVYITITSAFGGGTPFALFSIDGGLTWVARAVLAIAAGDLSDHLVLVRWAGIVQTIEDLPANARIGTISHTVSSEDPAFDGADVRNVYVNLTKGPQVDPDVPVVPVVPVVPAGPTEPILPVTGADVTPLFAGGFLLLLGGLLLLVVGGRQRRNA